MASFSEWFKNLFSRKKKKEQEEWDKLYSDTTLKADNLSLEPEKDPWRT
jgi:hypothetical protein